MEGGHGTAAAFGATIESLGVENALSVGMTASTLGLLVSGFIGGPVACFLIKVVRSVNKLKLQELVLEKNKL